MKDQKSLHDMLAYAGPNRNRLSPMSYIQEKVQTTSPMEITAILVEAILAIEEQLAERKYDFAPVPGPVVTEDLGPGNAEEIKVFDEATPVKRKPGRPKKQAV